MLGLTVKSTFVSERENVDEDICALGRGPTAVEVDLMQPLDPDKKPAVHTTPLNHVGLWVDDLPQGRAVDDGARRALRPAAFARARPATTSASSTPRATMNSRSAARAC
jgi:hypothetical protein